MAPKYPLNTHFLLRKRLVVGSFFYLKPTCWICLIASRCLAIIDPLNTLGSAAILSGRLGVTILGSTIVSMFTDTILRNNQLNSIQKKTQLTT